MSGGNQRRHDELLVALDELNYSLQERNVNWEVAIAAYGGNECLLLLERGWEPFSCVRN